MSLVESTFPPNHPPTSSNYTQEHIVVTINYRVNIFANPNARGLYNVTDLSVLNQRLDVEWVFEKVINFGGDPTRITINPIITGSVSSTGVAISDITMLFGTYLIAPGEITDLQIETSRTMQSLLLDFVKDSWLVLAGSICHENTSLNLSREEVASETREIVHAANRVTLAAQPINASIGGGLGWKSARTANGDDGKRLPDM
ncbi:hypothetical protein TCE0_033r08998 [Talaromyces pinophilus]|uniref:Carboxylesterase type B domain-containing protein n=1 Tax=Talaromyces pinophilus TaxID=128442 RepID=A0A6V8HB57_TALPI|nr:hypothetical protein TCE0_033r08998 [Talaromyces pinophilus]